MQLQSSQGFGPDSLLHLPTVNPSLRTSTRCFFLAREALKLKMANLAPPAFGGHMLRLHYCTRLGPQPAGLQVPRGMSFQTATHLIPGGQTTKRRTTKGIQVQ